MITRNVDFVRKQRVKQERSDIQAGHKPVQRVKPGVNRKVLAPNLKQAISMPKLVTQEDADIAAILGKLGQDEIAKLQGWLNNKVSDPKSSMVEDSSVPAPPPNMAPASKKVSRKMMFEELKGLVIQIEFFCLFILRDKMYQKRGQNLFSDLDLPA